MCYGCVRDYLIKCIFLDRCPIRKEKKFTIAALKSVSYKSEIFNNCYKELRINRDYDDTYSPIPYTEFLNLALKLESFKTVSKFLSLGYPLKINEPIIINNNDVYPDKRINFINNQKDTLTINISDRTDDFNVYDLHPLFNSSDYSTFSRKTIEFLVSHGYTYLEKYLNPLLYEFKYIVAFQNLFKILPIEVCSYIMEFNKNLNTFGTCLMKNKKVIFSSFVS